MNMEEAGFEMLLPSDSPADCLDLVLLPKRASVLPGGAFRMGAKWSYGSNCGGVEMSFGEKIGRFGKRGSTEWES